MDFQRILQGENKPKQENRDFLSIVQGYRGEQARSAPHTGARAFRERQRQARAEANRPEPQESPSFLERVQQFAPGRRLAEGIGDVLGAGRLDEANRQAQETINRQANDLVRLMQETDDEDQRARLNELLQRLLREGGEQAQRAVQDAESRYGRAAQRGVLASGAELGLLASTGAAGRFAGLGQLRQGVQTGRVAKRGVEVGTGITRARGAEAVARGGRAVSVMGAEGGLLGATQGLQDPNMTGRSLRRSIGTGLLGGAATGGVFTGGARAIGAARDTAPKIRNAAQAAKANSRTLERALASTPVQKTNTFLKQAQQKLQSNLAPLNRELDSLVKKGRLSRGQANAVKAEIQTAKYSADAIADNWRRGNDLVMGDEVIAKGSANVQTLTAPMDGKILNVNKPTPREANLYEYMATQDEVSQMLARQARGDKIDTRRLKSLQAKAKKLEEPEFIERNQAKNAAYEELGDVLVSQGLVSQQDMNYWRSTNQSYSRIQRVMDEMSELSGRGSGRGVASRGSTVAEQKIKGSTKEVVNPVLTLMDYSNNVFREVASNRAANAFIEALSEAGALGKQLRGADDVITRQSLKEALAYSKPLQKQMERFIKGQSKYVRRIQSEMNQIQREARGTVEKGLRAASKGEVVQPTAMGEVPAENIRAVIEEILSADKSTLNRLNKKFMNREPKLAQAIDELSDMQEVLDGVRAQRRQMVEEIAKRADEKIRNRPTIQRRVNGIKEIYETTPEIEVAAKSLGPVYLNTLGRVISAPVRFMQSTVTGGLNPAWAAFSIGRDMLEGLVLSSNARATHHPFNIIGSFAEMTGAKNKDLFNRFMATERGASSVIDLTRNAKSNARAVREASRMSLPKYKKAGTIIKRPDDLWRAVQDSSRWNEHFTKYVGFRGMYNNLIKQGVDEAEAFQRALWEARNVSGNLLETGDWSRMAQAVYPYFNPAIQGGASLAKAFKTRPGATSAKVLTAIQMPAAAAMAWNLSDPRRAEIYTDISPSERERYLIIVMPGTERSNGQWDVKKIPKAPGAGSLASPVEKAMLAMYGEDTAGTESFAQAIVKSLGMPFDVGDKEAFIGSAIPFQLKVPTEQAINYSFYKGEPIVPDWMIEDNPDEPYKRAYDDASSTQLKLAKALDISPLMIQNFTNNTLGEFGRNITYASDVAQQYARISEEGSGVGGRSPLESLTRGYSGSFGGVNQSKFRENISEVIDGRQDTSSRVTELIKDRKTTQADELAREHNQRIDALIAEAEERPEFVRMSDAQRDYLETLKFPMDGNRLSERSRKSRLNQ